MPWISLHSWLFVTKKCLSLHPQKFRNQYWTTNLAAVWGQLATGGDPLQESMSALGIPVMSKQSFMQTERQIGEWWWNALQESMKAAGKEEKQFAIEQGSYHQGITAITVVINGGWSKHTHKHSYNALSGVGVIIGKYTGKLLYVGVRNKFCAACVHNKKHKRKLTTSASIIGMVHQHQWSQISF